MPVKKDKIVLGSGDVGMDVAMDFNKEVVEIQFCTLSKPEKIGSKYKGKQKKVEFSIQSNNVESLKTLRRIVGGAIDKLEESETIPTAC